MHQFQKVEQVIVDVADEERSREHHQAILGNAEEVLQSLGLAYRVVNVCGGDLGLPQVQKFDIETWMPSRETATARPTAPRASTTSRRAAWACATAARTARCAFCHTLNNTVAASDAHAHRAAREPPALGTGQRRRARTVLRPYLGGRALLGEPVR